MVQESFKPIPISVIGLDQRQRSTLRKLFEERCDNQFVLMEEESSLISILDLDNYSGEQLWQEFRYRLPDRPLILVSLKHRIITEPNTLFVQKPIPTERLVAAINFLYQKPAPDIVTNAADFYAIEAEAKPKRQNNQKNGRRTPTLMNSSVEQNFIGTLQDIDPEDPEQRAKVYYHPDHYLQSHIQRALNLAVRYHKNVAVEGPWPAIKLMIESRTINVSADERVLRPFCKIPDSTREVPLTLFEGSDELPDTATEYSIEGFLWQSALWASRGRLPAGTDLHQPIYLRRWPNFTRLTITPHALAIAALWTEQPRSLLDTAATLNIPQRYVFAFYSAANAIQLSGETRRSVDTFIAPPAIEQSNNRGVLSRLLGHLRG